MSKKLTLEDLNKEFNPKGFNIEGPYESSNKRTNIKCLKCNNIFQNDIAHFKKRLNCPYCSGTINNKKRTTESIKKEIKELTNGEYEYYDGEYKNVHTPIKVKHIKCGNIFDVTMNNFSRNGTRCPKCKKVNTNRKLKTNEEFLNEVKIKNPDFEVLENYINSETKIKVKHKCGYIHEVKPRILLRGFGCPKCSGKKKKTHKEFLEEFYSLKDSDEYKILTKYINSKTPIIALHLNCNNIYKMRTNDFQQGYRCPYCNGNKARKLTTSEIAKRIKDLDSDFELVGEYINCRTKIKIKHLKCGNIFECKSNEFFNGNRCPYCRTSKGETAIIKYLENRNVKYN